MNLETMPESELVHLKAKLERELIQLRSSRKNLNNTIRNITNDMRDYRLRHQIIIENPQEAHRA